MEKIKISAVSYLNSKPFIYGLENSSINEIIDIQQDIPAICAQKLLAGQVDIGLVPVAILPLLKTYHIISDYCIGAEGPVTSVMLFSKVPIEKIDTILLDYQSRTSVQLIQLLTKQFWKIAPVWKETQSGFENEIKDRTAAVVIGDRALEMNGNYGYQYDLAEAWKQMTGLPFVFACWVSIKKLPDDFIFVFNKSLEYGLKSRDKVIDQFGKGSKLTHAQLKAYLYDSISYDLNKQKRKGLDVFLNYLSEKVV